MAEPVSQNLANHRRFVPLHHFVSSLILLLNLVWACYRLYHALRMPGRFVLADSLVQLLVAIALILMWVHLRSFPLTLQDRLIRLEMRLRLAQLLPEDLRGRVSELSVGQLVALRFASDRELPELTRKVLDEHITGGDAIKRQIHDWQGDYLRV
jgi:hypothetical protein